VIVVADSTKFAKVAFTRICQFNLIHMLVTDRLPPEPILTKLNQARVKVIVAS